jgi:release factor glutamine methyltransferase
MDRGALLAYPETPVSPPAARLAMEAVRRRTRREPVAYILARRAFRRIEVAVDSRVLIPRPETEMLVALALEQPEGARVHELGTGSGAVALAIAQERPDLAVTASEVSPPALEVARANVARLGLPVEVSLHRGLPAGDYDLVVANLPYVRDDEWPGLSPEIVRYEPREALVGGPDGLDAIREVVARSPAGLLVALEHAPAQAPAVRAMLDGADTRRDLAGLERVTVGRIR